MRPKRSGSGRAGVGQRQARFVAWDGEWLVGCRREGDGLQRPTAVRESTQKDRAEDACCVAGVPNDRHSSTQDAGLRRWRVRKKKRRRSTGRHVEIARGCRLVGEKNLRAREFAGEKLKSDAPTGLKVIGSHWSSAESAAQGSVAIDGATTRATRATRARAGAPKNKSSELMVLSRS